MGVLPFTYATSFIFTNENVAQTVTIFLHFAFGGIGTIATYFMQVIPSTFAIGDRLNWWLKIVPSFCLTSPIMFGSSKDKFFQARPDLLADDLSANLIGGNIYLLAAHFVFWIFILLLIEAGAFSWLLKAPNLLKKNRITKIN